MRQALIAGAVAALALGFNGVAGGQDTGGQETGRRSIQLFASNPRPRLGITVDLGTRDTDSIGAVIKSVRPGSPADKAGIRPGDIVTKLDGHAVASVAPDKSAAGLRLMSLAARLEPNDTVPVELRRDNRRKTVSVVTATDAISLIIGGSSNDAKGTWSLSFETTDSDASSAERFFGWITSPFAALETAPLNPQLGQYFGTTEGVLVISAPARLKLEGGDVILAVNGQKPSDPNHLMRMLQGHKTGEPIRLDVLRHGKRIELTIRPDKGSR